MLSAYVEFSKLTAELFPIANELLADGFTVYYLPDERPTLTTWLVFGKADELGNVNVGTVSYDRLNGFSVSASVKRTRKYGSGLVMWTDDAYQDYQPHATMLDACRAAAQPMVSNFLNVPLANEGPSHFAWCADRLFNLVAKAAN